MSHEILALEPKVIWKHFYSLTQVPRPSKKEDRIREFCAQFGRDLGLETIVDEIGNVIIKKPATFVWTNLVIPCVEACSLCAVPKASFT